MERTWGNGGERENHNLKEPNRLMAHSRAVDATGQIFGNRWGDAPLRWLTLALFAARTQLLCFGGEYDYRHRGPQNHCGLSFNLTVPDCQAAGGGAPVLPPPLPPSL